ncbi:putative sugar nucleotidyl transferase [Pedobacter faecalis]|uniref:putative sugar nucleotidyl transferase n=1 Tax=Pedobacter faecalis TaxID=3041495 RepID=UPI00254CA385|nr:putative sugar nucleotidyl transferase [Pedobacter sp. ELA7]
MTINLFDDDSWQSLRPLTFTRPVGDLRVGILTIAEKWQKHLKVREFGFVTQNYLSVKFPKKMQGMLFINGSICPDERLLDSVQALEAGEALVKGDIILAYCSEGELTVADLQNRFHKISYPGDFIRIVYPEDVFKYNDTELRRDFSLLTAGRTSLALSSTNTIIGEDFFAEEGAEAECATFNTRSGPVYLGYNAQVWEGSNIKGSFALCDNSQVKMGAKIYGQTTIGPGSRVGGEINNAVIWGHSSKGHDGYLGNAVMGEWCNIGADTNNSNLKNNYAEVRLWDYERQSFRKTGLQFCGLIMADHAKCGINTMFNTGTVVGVGANVFGAGFPRNFVADFAWGGAHGFEVYALNKMFETAEKVYARRNMDFGQIDKDILSEIFENTNVYRRF